MRIPVRLRLATGAAALVLAAVVVGVQADLHHRLYRALLYPVVARRALEHATGETAIADQLREFVYLNVRTPRDAPVLDDSAADTLIRGFGYCDQVVMAFLRLSREVGLTARMTFLRDADGTSRHSIAEVLLDDGWRVVDVYTDFAPRLSDGEPATVTDLLEHPELLDESRAEPAWYEHALPITTSEDTVEGLGQVADFLADGLVDAAPDPLLDGFQDLYLLLPPPAYDAIDFAPDEAPAEARFEPYQDFDAPDGRLYFRARNYHLFQRTDEAERAYRALLEQYPDSRYADDALYQLGLLRLTQGEDPSGARRAIEELQSAYPDTPWIDEARYVAARALEDLGACEDARRLFQAVEEAGGNGMEDARERLDHLACA